MMSDSQQRDEPRVFWKEWIKGRVLAGCRAAFVAGSRHADYLRALGFRKPIAAGYDAVDNAHFEQGAQAARADAANARGRLHLPSRYFLCISRFLPKKNLPTLLRAFAIYRRGAPAPVRDLVLLGEGALRPALEAQIAQAGLTDAVRMPGFIQYDELSAHYGLADALILASTSEQWGLAVNEAMAAGLPVLVSEACGCVPELVEPGVNGFVFDPQDENALAALMTNLASDEKELEAMGRASQRIIARWSLEAFSEHLWETARLACRDAQTHPWTPLAAVGKRLLPALLLTK